MKDDSSKNFFSVGQITRWIGSIQSLFTHTLLFVGSFALGFFHLASWTDILLVVTTIVSLEAIYLAIFIQMTVNRHAKELQEVSDDVEEIQEDIEDISEDVEGLGEHVEDLHEDFEEMTEDEEKDEARKKHQVVTLEQLSADVRRVLADIESLKSK